MIPYTTYKLVHFTGIFMILMALGGVALHMASGGSRADFKQRKWAAIFHGVGMFLALLGGFGTLARLYPGQPIPGWIYGKLVIWLLLGAALTLLYKLPKATKGLWFVILALALTAGGFALYKPFL